MSYKTIESMNHMDLKQLESVLSPHGYRVRVPSEATLQQFYTDYDEEDKYEAAEVWKIDWQDALDAAFRNPTSLFVAESLVHSGSAVFGLAPVTAQIGQIWMLQSKTFASSASALHGRSWPHRGARMVSSVIALSLQSFQTVFNFIPATQKPTIRLLKLGGFEFFPDPRGKSNILFFAAGSKGGVLANNPSFWDAYLG
jgi:hypothetical protein